jgi:hypothetical protein
MSGSSNTPRDWPVLQLLTTPSGAALGVEPIAADDLLASIRQLISTAQKRPELATDNRLKQALAHLWAAADTLEGFST